MLDASGPGHAHADRTDSHSGANADAAASAASTPGRALPDAVRRRMERLLGADFSGVRVYESAAAIAIGAQAFARGDQLYFRPGAFDPASFAGQELLGHELTHVLQQRAGRVAPGQFKMIPGLGEATANVDSSLEAEADAGGRAVAAGEKFDVPGLRAGASSANGSSSPSGVAQLKPTSFGDIRNKTTGKRNIDWDPHRTQPTKTGATNEEFIAFGTGARVANTVDMAIAWGGKLGSTIDAATNEPSSLHYQLTPRVAVGAVPDGSKRAAQLAKAAQSLVKAKKKGSFPYSTIQLVPADLGGDASDDNVLVVPDAAAADLEKRVYRKLFALVGTQNACLEYQVDVVHEDDPSGVRYASKLRFRWQEVDATGAAVPSTQGQVTIYPASPTDYAQRTAGRYHAKPLINGAANRALEKTKTMKRDAAAAVSFQTEVEWGPTNAEGDGTMMEARKLGPDHKMGEEPKTKSLWSARVKKMQAIAKNAGRAKKYVAGHLLNHQLGGPGNDARNLAPIPSDANSKFQTEVETHVKHIVNVRKGWAYFRVDVSHVKIGTTTFPKNLRATWHQLDEWGAPVPNTTGDKSLSLDPPTKGGGYKAKTHQRDAGAEDLQPGTATTVLAFDELVLDNDPAVLRPKILIMRPLIDALKAMDLNGDFTRANLTQDVGQLLATYTPQAAELAAYKTIVDVTNEVGALTAPSDLKPSRLIDVRVAIGTASFHRLARVQNAHAAAGVLVNATYNDTRATAIRDALKQSADEAELALSQAEKLALQLVDVSLQLHTSAEEGLQGMILMANKARAWLGLPPLDPKTSLDDASKEARERMQEGVDNVNAYYDCPATPMQIQETGETQGFDAEGSDHMRILLGTHASQMQPGTSRPPNYTAVKSAGLDKKMIAILCDASQRATLLSLTWTGPPNEVAATIATLAQMIEATPTIDPRLVLKHTVADLYRGKTRSFRAYFQWLAPQL
jgi:Domain of unknown function (DUF4157)